jgi:hypothetical protein
MPQTWVPDHNGADAGNRVRQRGKQKQKGAGWRETAQPGDCESGALAKDGQR